MVDDDSHLSVLVEFVVIESAESEAVRRRQSVAICALLKWIADQREVEGEQPE
jgi:hypothetical protein